MCRGVTLLTPAAGLCVQQCQLIAQDSAALCSGDTCIFLGGLAAPKKRRIPYLLRQAGVWCHQAVPRRADGGICLAEASLGGDCSPCSALGFSCRDDRAGRLNRWALSAVHCRDLLSGLISLTQAFDGVTLSGLVFGRCDRESDTHAWFHTQAPAAVDVCLFGSFLAFDSLLTL